jgi:cysteinyl-tRNA synthetase
MLILLILLLHLLVLTCCTILHLLVAHLLCCHFQKLQQKLEQQKKKQQQQKQQKQKQQQAQKQPEEYIQAMFALETEIKNKISILGLMPPSSLAEALKQLKDKALKRAGLTEELLQEQIEQRTAARKNKQFDVSDQIRKQLGSKGIALMDEPTGTVWRPCEPESE